MRKIVLPLLLLLTVSAGVLWAQTAPLDTLFLKTTLSYVGASCVTDAKSPVEVAYITVNDDGVQSETKGKLKNCGQDVASLRAGVVASLLAAAKMSLPEMNDCNIYCFTGRVAESSDKDMKVIESAFQKVFGAALVKERMKGAAGDAFIYRYNAPALTAAFNKIYRKPNASVAGYALGVVYNGLFKADVAERLKKWQPILKNKAWLPKKTAEMTQKFKTSAEFSGSEVYYKFAEELKLDDHSQVGFLIRRDADGSLPAILGALKMILQDYDPATAAANASIL